MREARKQLEILTFVPHARKPTQRLTRGLQEYVGIGLVVGVVALVPHRAKRLA